MERKQAFKKAKNLINKAASLYGLRDYTLDNYIDFPLGLGMAKLYKGKKMDITENMAVCGIKAKKDRSLTIKLKLEVQNFTDEEIQQVINSVMRILNASVTPKANDIVLENSDVKQGRLNAIGKTNNACIYLLERMAKEIIDRVEKDNLSEILQGLSSRVLSYLTIVIRRYMISQDMDIIMERKREGAISEYEESLISNCAKYKTLFKSIVTMLEDRGLNQIEDHLNKIDKDVSHYVHSGYINLFK